LSKRICSLGLPTGDVKSSGDRRPGAKQEKRKTVMNTKTMVGPSVRNRFWFIIAVLALLLQGCAHAPTSEINVPRITKEELKPMVGSPEVTIVDVRSAEDWKEAEWKIKGAVWVDRNEENSSWMDKYPKDKTLVFY
jgi:hypothetical protein